MRKHSYNALWWKSYGNGMTSVTTTSADIYGEATMLCVYFRGGEGRSYCLYLRNYSFVTITPATVFSFRTSVLLSWSIFTSKCYKEQSVQYKRASFVFAFSDNPLIFPSRAYGYILLSGKMLFHCQIAQLVSTVQMLLRLDLTISIIILLCITAILGCI